ncbi:hypothetical protein [Priestia endophytica]|nr:hypothetical protein [Priestia endophytica]MCY8235532.1 hypothetical protein [Priestia endophytica]
MSLKGVKLNKQQSKKILNEIVKGPNRSRKRTDFAKECLRLAKERDK